MLLPTYTRTLHETDMLQAVVQRKLPPGVEMSVNVLTSGYWPSYRIIEATLPQELASYSQVELAANPPSFMTVIKS